MYNIYLKKSHGQMVSKLPSLLQRKKLSPVLFYVNEDFFDKVNAAVNTTDIQSSHVN